MITTEENGFKTIKEAEAVVGTLSKPSKMPGYAYGLPASLCQVGSKLALVKNSVCANCYALKGRYRFANVQNAQMRRYMSLPHPRWVEAMVFLIHRRECEYFRWHDSGDIQGVWHLEKIVAVANACPDTKFWVPTRETKMVKEYKELHGEFPQNLTVRVSATMVGGPPPPNHSCTSTVVLEDQTCPAPHQGGECRTCRMCWDPSVSNVSYKEH